MMVVTMLAAGCSGRHRAVMNHSMEQTLQRMPGWYVADQQDSARLVAKATAVSSDLQTALDIAKSEARADLLLQVETRTTAITKRFREQSGAARDATLLSQFTAVSKDVAAQTLRGVQLRRHEVQGEGTVYRAYVLLEVPTGEAARQLLDRVRQDDQLRTELRADKAFEELTREVQRYEASRDRAARPAPDR